MSNQQMKLVETLKQGIEELALKRAPEGEEFVLKSGKKSNYYLDLRKVVLSPVYNQIACNCIMDMIATKDIKFDAIGGPALGAIPIIGGLAYHCGNNILSKTSFIDPSFFFVRKEEKGHGTKQSIEGTAKEGQRAIIVEDVTTTGGSAAKAIKDSRGFGMIVNDVICLVDREEGGREHLANLGVELHPILTKSEFGL